MKKRSVRIAATLVVTGLCTAYIIWKIDLGRTVHILAHAELRLFPLALAIMVRLGLADGLALAAAARGARDPRPARAGSSARTSSRYTAGQVLPTAVGGDAVRIYETARRHPGSGGPVAASVLLERALGGAATLDARRRSASRSRSGSYDVGAYLWVELAFVVASRAPGGAALLAPRCGRCWRGTAPLLRALRLERPVRAVYEGIHSYRGNAAAARRRVRADARRPVGARARDLGGGQGGRRRSLAAARTT